MEEPIRISPRFSYALCKRLDGVPGAGTTVSWNNRVQKLYGACLEKFCPNNTSLSEEEYQNCSISVAAYLDAYKRRMKYFQRLYTLDECTYAIHRIGSVGISFECFESIYIAPNGDVPLPTIGEKRIGSHTVAAHGYSYPDKYINFINSWGEKWGNKGVGRLPMDYFEEELINDAHTFIIDSYPIQTLQPEEVHNLKNKKKEKFIVIENAYEPLRNSTKSPLYVYDIYSAANIIIGFLNMSLFNENTIEIEDFFILPQYQNLGFGTALLKLIEKQTKESDIKNIIGWIGTQDIVSNRETAVLNFFRSNHYSISRYNTRYKDAFYKFEKIILN